MSTVEKRWSIVVGVALGVASLLVAVLPADGQESPGFKAANGRVSYRLYCASCHGEGAEGDGPVAKYLNVPPSDLTRIAERYGEWPEEDLYAKIDGRQEVRAHGRRDMPVWGDVLQSPLADDLKAGTESEERAERKIEELVLFLKTIQVQE